MLRIIHAPRSGEMRYVVQERSLSTFFIWTDVGGHDWIGWRNTLEEAIEMRDRFNEQDKIERMPVRVVG